MRKTIVVEIDPDSLPVAEKRRLMIESGCVTRVLKQRQKDLFPGLLIWECTKQLLNNPLEEYF